MARITVEDCLAQVGDDNRFSLVHLAVERIRQHRAGEPFLLKGKNEEIVMTLREIAAGKVTFENIRDLPRLRKLSLRGIEEDQETEGTEEEAAKKS